VESREDHTYTHTMGEEVRHWCLDKVFPVQVRTKLCERALKAQDNPRLYETPDLLPNLAAKMASLLNDEHPNVTLSCLTSMIEACTEQDFIDLVRHRVYAVQALDVRNLQFDKLALCDQLILLFILSKQQPDKPAAAAVLGDEEEDTEKKEEAAAVVADSAHKNGKSKQFDVLELYGEEGSDDEYEREQKELEDEAMRIEDETRRLAQEKLGAAALFLLWFYMNAYKQPRHTAALLTKAGGRGKRGVERKASPQFSAIINGRFNVGLLKDDSLLPSVLMALGASLKSNNGVMQIDDVVNRNSTVVVKWGPGNKYCHSVFGDRTLELLHDVVHALTDNAENDPMEALDLICVPIDILEYALTSHYMSECSCTQFDKNINICDFYNYLDSQYHPGSAFVNREACDSLDYRAYDLLRDWTDRRPGSIQDYKKTRNKANGRKDAPVMAATVAVAGDDKAPRDIAAAAAEEEDGGEEEEEEKPQTDDKKKYIDAVVKEAVEHSVPKADADPYAPEPVHMNEKKQKQRKRKNLPAKAQCHIVWHGLDRYVPQS
jgi:hypothetical protein